jgi:hypothetical protein
MTMLSTHLSTHLSTRTKPDTVPLVERIAKEERHQDCLTHGQFDAGDFGERKLWIWAEHDLRRQQVPVLPGSGTRRRLWRKPQQP